MRKLLLVLSVVLVAGAWAAQNKAQNNMKKMDMNDMPYAKVKQALSNPQTAQHARMMAKKNGVLLMKGQEVMGKEVTLKGELTGANCYLSQDFHLHKHSLCAKACVAHGAPIVFLAGDGTVYFVLTPKDGVELPEKAYDDLGRPGVTVHGKEVSNHGVKALAVESVTN